MITHWSAFVVHAKYKYIILRFAQDDNRGFDAMTMRVLMRTCGMAD